MSDFTPRTTKEGMYQSRYWYSENPFYPAYGLPNCTCYAWGRVFEIGNVRPTPFPLSDGGDWYYDAIANGLQVSQTPQLGAVACWDDGGAGHVAVVESIDELTGQIYMSESRYRRPLAPYPPDTDHYFDYTYFNSVTHRLSWMDSSLVFQGYILNPYSPVPPSPGGLTFNEFAAIIRKKKYGIFRKR